MNKLVFNKTLRVWENTASNGLTIRITPSGIISAQAELLQRWLVAHGLTQISDVWGNPIETTFWAEYDQHSGNAYTLAYWLERAG